LDSYLDLDPYSFLDLGFIFRFIFRYWSRFQTQTQFQIHIEILDTDSYLHLVPDSRTRSRSRFI